MKYLLVFISFVLAGCAQQSSLPLKEDIQKNESGEYMLTATQLNKLKAGGATYVPDHKRKPHITIAGEDYEAIRKSKEPMVPLLDVPMKRSEIVSSGSLRKSVDRIMNENGWYTLIYDAPDFYIDKPFIVKGYTLPEIIKNATKKHKLFMCVDETDRSITLISDE